MADKKILELDASQAQQQLQAGLKTIDGLEKGVKAFSKDISGLQLSEQFTKSLAPLRELSTLLKAINVQAAALRTGSVKNLLGDAQRTGIQRNLNNQYGTNSSVSNKLIAQAELAVAREQLDV